MPSLLEIFEQKNVANEPYQQLNCYYFCSYQNSFAFAKFSA